MEALQVRYRMKVIIDEVEKKVELHLTRASDFDSPALEAAFPFYKREPKMEDIDQELHPLIRHMWENGYRTFNCCSGHRKHMGMILFLPPRKRMLRGAIWEADEPIPQKIQDLKGILTAQIILGKGDDAIRIWFAKLKGILPHA